jgi:hypothetical protein
MTSAYAIVATAEPWAPSARAFQRHFARLGLDTRPDWSPPQAALSPVPGRTRLVVATVLGPALAAPVVVRRGTVARRRPDENRRRPGGGPAAAPVRPALLIGECDLRRRRPPVSLPEVVSAVVRR